MPTQKNTPKPLTIAQFVQKYGPNVFSSEGIRRGLQMEKDIPKMHQIAAEQIDAIKQTNSKGFRIIDIDPNQLTRSEYSCIYTQDILTNIIGQEIAFENGVYRFDNTGAATSGSTVNPYWRTVNIGIPGNFLKIEILPVRPHDAALVGSLVGGFNPDYVKTNTEPQNTNQENFATQIASKRDILLDFETPTANPVIVRDGDCFESTFTQIFLTFKQFMPRIRITIGYNSKVISNNDQPQSLAMWDGYGLSKEKHYHPSPFCQTEADVIGSYSGIACGAATVTSLLMGNWLAADVSNPTRNINLGVGVLYITGFSGLGYLQAGGDFINNTSFELFIADFDQSTLAITSLKKRIASFSVSMYSVGVANGVGMTTQSQGANIVEPIRVTLNGGECIALRLIPCFRNVAHNVFCKFEMTGYVMGGFSIMGAGRPSVNVRFKEHPFPFDNNFTEYPKT